MTIIKIIIAAVILFFVFLVFCCIRVASLEDQEMEELMTQVKKEDGEDDEGS